MSGKVWFTGDTHFDHDEHPWPERLSAGLASHAPNPDLAPTIQDRGAIQ